MKVQQAKPVFQPLTITIESEQELQALEMIISSATNPEIVEELIRESERRYSTKLNDLEQIVSFSKALYKQLVYPIR